MQITKFIKEVRGEMNYVKWPTRKMVIGSTIAVLLISLFTAIYLGGEDFWLQKLLTRFVK